MGMARFTSQLAAVFLFLISVASSTAQAQSYTYDVLVDLDRNPSTGCNLVAPNPVNGIERRIRATVDASIATVTDVTVEDCQGASFGPPVTVGGPHPVGLNNGINASDVVELSAPLSALSIGANTSLQFIFRATDTNGNDILATADGGPNGGPILFGLPISVPTLSAVGVAILAVILLLLAWRHHRASASVLSAVLLILAAGLVIAVNFVTDGNTGDWIGEAPRATDPVGDSSNGAPGNDIQAAFFALENATLFFRIDVTDIESQPPIAVADNFATNEDTPLNITAPGVLGNDSDPGMAALSAVLVTGPANAASFTLNNDGSFNYQPNTDFNGNDSFSYVADNGASQSAAATVSLVVNPVNDAPSFVVGPDQIVLEDAAPQAINNWATAISAGPADENTQTLTFNITGNDNPGLFTTGPTIDASGNLSFTPAPDASGVANINVTLSDNGGTANGGIDTSVPATFVITVTAVNDAPSFNGGPNQTVVEDAGAQLVNAWASAITTGPANEVGQALNFIFSGNTNPALFATGPSIDAAGNLSYTPAADANGSAMLTVFLMDNGGTANGGVDSSTAVSFTIDVTAVNDAPSFVIGPDQTIAEDSGAQSVNAWATALSAGPTDEAAQTLSLNIVGNDNPALFTVAPIVDSAGNLSYTPAADASGSANISINLSDSGGTANGGIDTSATVVFAININQVNDAPFFAAGANINLDEDSGAQNLAWASAISPGPASEAGQALNFIVAANTSDSTLSFSTAPTVNAATGNVQFTAAANAYGTATFNVSLQDNGGTANGGVDTFGPLVLTITINPLNDAPTVAAAPSYSATTNIQIDVPAAAGLLNGASDDATEAADPAGPAAPGTNLSVGNGANPAPTTTTNGGNLSINTVDGSFSYNPPAGFTGIDSFSYVVCDDGIGAPGALCSGAVNVNINVSGSTIWFINNNVTGGLNDGRLSTPFESLAAFNARQNGGGVADPAAGDLIFLTSSVTAYSDGANGISLLDNQTLFGQGTTGTTFDTFTGITPAPNSAPRPALGGAAPFLTSTASAVNLSTSAPAANTLRGFNIGDSTAGFGINGNVAGTLNVLEVNLQGLGALVNIDGLGTGILNAAFGTMSSTSTQTPNAFNVQNMAGGILSAVSTNIIAPTANAIQATNNAAGTQINFGNLANLVTTAGTGFNLNNAGIVTVAAAPISNLQTSGGPALLISNTIINGFNFADLSTNASSNGINLNNVAGNISAVTGTIQNTSGDGVTITGGSGNLSYAGTITASTGRAVFVNNHTGGNISFGPINNTTTGVVLNNNTGTSFFFNATMTLSTGNNTAFNASAGGNIEATGTNSTIVTTSGTGISINGLTITANNFNLRSLSSNGAVNGIALTNTGTFGGLVITGDGTNARNGSGGIIQNTTGDAVALVNANNVRLSSMNLTNTGDSVDSASGGNILANNDHAIQSEGGGNITLSGIFIANPAAGGWEAVDLGGVNRIDNNSRFEGIDVSNMQALEVRNTDTNMPGFTINNSQFASQADTNGSSYVIFSGFGTSVMSLTVENSSLFDDVFGQALQVNSGEGAVANGAVNLVVNNSSFTNAVDGTVGIGATGGIGGLVVSSRLDAVHTFDISGNTWNDLGRPLANGGVVTVQGIGGNNKLLDGNISGNNTDRIGYPTAAEPTTTVGHRFLDAVTENDITRLDLELNNNDVDDTSREVFFISSRGASGDFDFAITNNRLGQVTPIGQTDRETIEILSEDSSNMRALVSNNLITGNTGLLDEIVDIDAENTSVQDMLFTGNTVVNVQAAGGREIVVDTENGTSTLCMRFLNNTATEAEFDVAGTHNVEDFANRVANNPGVGAFIDGVGVTNVAPGTCIAPTF